MSDRLRNIIIYGSAIAGALIIVSLNIKTHGRVPGGAIGGAIGGAVGGGLAAFILQVVAPKR
jgi:hypothetical protein